MTSHSLFRTLKHLEGNARGVVYAEPLWGIPANLYAPYVSVYMLALGVTDMQIGLIATISTVVQVLWTLAGGAITDKLGRKRTTLIFDLLSWSVPCIIWAVAQNFTYFLVAALVNSVWRVVHNSWICLLVEDTDPVLLVDVYSWIYIAGLLAAFVAPLAGLLVDGFGLVDTLRGLYLLAAVMMAAKSISMNAMVTETRQGRVRMAETAGESVFSVMRGSGGVLRQLLHSRATLYTLGLMLIYNIVTTVRASFWSVLVSQELGMSDASLAFYPAVRSLTMLAFYFFVMPKIQRGLMLGRGGEHWPMIAGFVLFVVSQLMLTLIPAGIGWLLFVATVLEGAAMPLTATFLDKMTVTTVDPKERARILSLLTALVLVVSSPFGWLSGQLSTTNRRLPFVMLTVLLALAAILAYAASRDREPSPAGL